MKKKHNPLQELCLHLQGNTILSKISAYIWMNAQKKNRSQPFPGVVPTLASLNNDETYPSHIHQTFLRSMVTHSNLREI